MVIVGFTDGGDVIVNDPASHRVADDEAVRMVYDRAEFSVAWLAGSGGIVYVIPPPEAGPARSGTRKPTGDLTRPDARRASDWSVSSP